MDDDTTQIYKGGKLSEIVINSLRPFLAKIKESGIKKSLGLLMPGVDIDEFVIRKIKNQLIKKRGTELGKNLGRVDVQYRRGGVQIEPCGMLRFLVKRITISDAKIIESFNHILNQIEKKYIVDDEYIISRIDDIVFTLLGTGIYKPKNSEEKTLYDLASLILINYYKTSSSVPDWIEPALAGIEQGAFIKKWIDVFSEYISEMIVQVSSNIFFDFKVTFDSFAVRFFLNKKTNKGQISRIIDMLGLDIPSLIYNFAKSYVSPSFIRGASEILSDLASGFLSKLSNPNSFDGNSFLKDFDVPFNISVTLGKNPNSSRNLRWYTGTSVKYNQVEYSYSPDFLKSIKIEAVCQKSIKTFPTINLGLVAGYKPLTLHKYSVSLNNLAPGTIYYRFLSDSGELSSAFSFDIKEKSDEFKFMIFADSQGMVKSDYQSFSHILETAARHAADSDFMIHLGDFVDNGNNEEYWNMVLESNVWKEFATVSLSGNHEARLSAVACRAGSESPVLEHFNIANYPSQDTSKGVYYSFEYNDTLFIVLNTNAGAECGIDETQYKWALTTAQRSKAFWKVLLSHKSLYSNGPHHKDPDVKVIGEQIAQIAYAGGIDLVLSGHDHVYARTPAMSEGRIVPYNAGGTVFVVPGTSGVKNYKQSFPADFPAEKLSAPGGSIHCEVSVNKNSLVFNAYLHGNNKNYLQNVDSFTLKKHNESSYKHSALEISEIIESIIYNPCAPHSAKISRALKLYDALSYSQKLKVSGYEKLLKIDYISKCYEDIRAGEIRTVKNRREFMDALNHPNVKTIVTKCDEIKFENKFACHGKVYVNRNLCVRGDAKLCFVKFVVNPNVLLVIAGNVSVDNTRKPLSVYRALDCIKMRSEAALVVRDNASLNCGYGWGVGGRAISANASGCFVYLCSSGHNFSKNEFMVSPDSSSTTIIKSGKYFAGKNHRTIVTGGYTEMLGGFVQSIFLGEDSELIINGGTIGSFNKQSEVTPLESSGKITINAGIINSNSNNDSVAVCKQSGEFTINKKYSYSIDIKGRVIYN